MWSRIKSSLIADLKIISNNAGFLVAMVMLLIMIIFLKLLFPVISDFIYSKTGFLAGNYYSLVAISLVSIIPMLFGMVYAFIVIKEKASKSGQVMTSRSEGVIKILQMRLIAISLISFIVVLITIVLSEPVPSEGWLRNIYAAFLISFQSPFIFLFIVALEGRKIAPKALSWLYTLFIIAVPVGLLFHHPWNYLVFYSPLYWTAWAWIIGSPTESLIYGSIAVILTSAGGIFLIRHFLHKHAG